MLLYNEVYYVDYTEGNTSPYGESITSINA